MSLLHKRRETARILQAQIMIITELGVGMQMKRTCRVCKKPKHQLGGNVRRIGHRRLFTCAECVYFGEKR